MSSFFDSSQYKPSYSEMDDPLEGSSTGCAATVEFSAWVQEKGGDRRFLGILLRHGFTSKMSLGTTIYSSQAKLAANI